MTRELGALSAILGAGVLLRLLDQYFWRWYFEERRKVPIPKFVREVTSLLVFVVVVVLVLQLQYGVRVPGHPGGVGRGGHHPRLRVARHLGEHHRRVRAAIRPSFSVGDWLQVDQQHVQAVEINWRSTRFITNDSVQLDVPNQQLIKQTITNYHGGGSLHAMRLEIAVDSEVPPTGSRTCSLTPPPPRRA